MCFFKTEESKILVAKRDIKVYKIGDYANFKVFTSYFQKFIYLKSRIVTEEVKFTDRIEEGLHSFLSVKISRHTPNQYEGWHRLLEVGTNSNFSHIINLSMTRAFLGEFIIPNGATYCLNYNNEVVSDKLMYTGKYVELTPYKNLNAKELWKEK